MFTATSRTGYVSCFSFLFNYCYFEIVENYLNLWTISLTSGGGSSTYAKSEGTSGLDKNEDCYGPKRWFGMEIVIGGAFTWCFISSHLFI